jgi:hypothetical protein
MAYAVQVNNVRPAPGDDSTKTAVFTVTVIDSFPKNRAFCLLLLFEVLR